MIIFLLFIQLLVSQEIEFEVRDNSLYEPGYKQGLEVELDSVRFINSSLGIDTTLEYSKIIDLTDVLVINSVNENKDEPFQINLTNDYLKINSNSIIRSVKVYDILGKEVININKNQLVENQTFDDRLYFIQIISENGIYSSKILKSNDNSSTSILLNDNSWKITLYKYAFKPKTIEYTTLPTKIEEELIRKRIRIELDLETDKVRYYYYYRAFDRMSDYDTYKTFGEESILYDSISLNKIDIEIYNSYNSSVLIKREHNSFVSNKRKLHYYNIDSLYNLNQIIFGYTDSPDYYINIYEIFKLELLDSIDLNELYNGNKNQIKYNLKDKNFNWSYLYEWVNAYSINSFETKKYNSYKDSKLLGTITITLID